MKKFDVKDHAPSLLPDGYDFDLVWSDEFDGDTLDMTKWDYRLCMMGVRFPAWTDKGVKIENSCAVFSVFEENGELVLVDYKTDYVKNENELLDLYKNQIAFYKSAVAKTLKMPVKEAVLYSFCLDKPCLYK